MLKHTCSELNSCSSPSSEDLRVQRRTGALAVTVEAEEARPRPAGAGDQAGDRGQRAIALAAIEHALFEDPDLMPDTVPFADQHGAGPEHPAVPNRARFRPAQPAAGPGREPAQRPFLHLVGDRAQQRARGAGRRRGAEILGPMLGQPMRLARARPASAAPRSSPPVMLPPAGSDRSARTRSRSVSSDTTTRPSFFIKARIPNLPPFDAFGNRPASSSCADRSPSFQARSAGWRKPLPCRRGRYSAPLCPPFAHPSQHTHSLQPGKASPFRRSLRGFRPGSSARSARSKNPVPGSACRQGVAAWVGADFGGRWLRLARHFTAPATSGASKKGGKTHAIG